MKSPKNVIYGFAAAALLFAITTSAAQQRIEPKTPQQEAAERDRALQQRMAQCTSQVQAQGLRAGTSEFNRALSDCLKS
jgi:hypothetical protein